MLRRLRYPYDLINALLKYVQPRCCACGKPATRRWSSGALIVVLTDGWTYCDACPKAPNPSLPDGTFQELPSADLVRACNKYLSTTEQLT